MSFPLTYLLIPYLVFVGVWLILSIVALYHIIRFGGKKVGAMLLAVFYIAGSIGLITVSYTELSFIDWRNEASILSNKISVPSFEIPAY